MFKANGIELIIFDLDGTLVEFPFYYLFQETQRLISEYNNEITSVDEDILRTCFSDFDYFRFIPESEREGFMEYFWKHFDFGRYPSMSVFPGVFECLELLCSLGNSLAIATARNCSNEEIVAELTKSGLLPYMSHVAVRTDTKLHWADKRPHILQICEKLNVSPHKTIMIGDIPNDIISAKESGVGATVAVLTGGINEEVLKETEPDLILENVCQLSDYFT